jgi:hypothetical protein
MFQRWSYAEGADELRAQDVVPIGREVPDRGKLWRYCVAIASMTQVYLSHILSLATAPKTHQWRTLLNALCIIHVYWSYARLGGSVRSLFHVHCVADNLNLGRNKCCSL